MTPTTMTNGRMPAWMESAWMARYLDRQLTHEETATFEAYVLDKSELLDALEADSGLRDALAGDARKAHDLLLELHSAHLQKAGRTENAMVQDGLPPQRPQAVRTRWNRLRRQAIASVAACASVLFGVAIGWEAEHFFSNTSGSQMVFANPDVVRIETMLGDGSDVQKIDSIKSRYVLVEVAVPQNAESVVLKIVSQPEEQLTVRDSFVSFVLDRAVFDSETVVELSYDCVDKRCSRRLTPLHNIEEYTK